MRYFSKVRDEGRVISKALYVAVGVNLEGRKELLGLWLGESEGAKFYAQILTELQALSVAHFDLLLRWDNRSRPKRLRPNIHRPLFRPA
jgi:transposase-like protein